MLEAYYDVFGIFSINDSAAIERSEKEDSGVGYACVFLRSIGVRTRWCGNFVSGQGCFAAVLSRHCTLSYEDSLLQGYSLGKNLDSQGCVLLPSSKKKVLVQNTDGPGEQENG